MSYVDPGFMAVAIGLGLLAATGLVVAIDWPRVRWVKLMAGLALSLLADLFFVFGRPPWWGWGIFIVLIVLGGYTWEWTPWGRRGW